MSQSGLFDSFSIGTHQAAFDAWLQSQEEAGLLRQPSSVGVYRDMWATFIAWCAGQNPPLTLENLTTADLLAFQASRSGHGDGLAVSPLYANRLLRLVDRVLAHRASAGHYPKNPAAIDAITSQPRVRYATAAREEGLPKALTTVEAKSLINYLSRARPRLGQPAANLTWQNLRTRASVALQLGAGLTPIDVRSLTMDSPIIAGGRVKGRPWKIAVPASGSSPERETPVAIWGAELLQYWLQVRADLRIPGPWLFPSTRTGKPWSRDAQYAAARAVLADAGIDEQEGGSFRLRHTFALRQLRHGADAEKVADWLGVTDPKVVARYRRMISQPEDVI